MMIDVLGAAEEAERRRAMLDSSLAETQWEGIIGPSREVWGVGLLRWFA